MTEKPNFFYKIENNGRINQLGDEFMKAFTPEPQLPLLRKVISELK